MRTNSNKNMDLFELIEHAQNSSGLPLSVDVYEMSLIPTQELITLCFLADPLIVWRGLVCASKDLSPSWIIYKADESQITWETVKAANILTKMNAIITLPGARDTDYLEHWKQERLKDPNLIISSNYDYLCKISEKLRLIPHIPVKPKSYNEGISLDTELKLTTNLPVLFNCQLEKYKDFTEEYHHELIKLRHGLRNVFKISRNIIDEFTIRNVIQELDYQIAKLDDVYKNALKKRWLSGTGIIIGMVITSLTLIVPEELKQILLAIGSPTTLTASLRWIGEKSLQKKKWRNSDYYLAWRFQKVKG